MKTETTDLTNKEILLLKTLLKTISKLDSWDEQLADAMGYELDEYNELADGVFEKLARHEPAPDKN